MRTRGIFKASLFNRNERRKLRLTFWEIKAAELKLLKYMQGCMSIHIKKNKLWFFKTVMNQNGLYTLKTNILNRDDDPKFLCPMLLDSSQEIVHLLVRETHKRLGHAGVLIIKKNVRERSWITSSRRMARSIISKFLICKR